MDLNKIIKERRSVRSFDDQREVSEHNIEILRQDISEVKSPFDGQVTIALEKFDLDGPYKPSTYGTISGASWFLLMGFSQSVESQLSAGFEMEQVVLKATDLGLGTCWIAATFKGSDFDKKVDFPENTPLRIISPVGYAADSRSFRESATRLLLRSGSRKPFESMFFSDDFTPGVDEGSVFYQPLTLMRLAPSAKNSQPWRALVKGKEVYFYIEKKSEASIVDLGIALSHFALSLSSDGGGGQWTFSGDFPARKGWTPVVKFILRD